MKKILSIILCITLMLTALPLGAFNLVASATIFEYDGGYTYFVENGEATIIDANLSFSFSGIIPSTLGGYPVTSIGNSAFRDCTSLTSITIPNSVTSIGNSAFSGCKNLTSITIPNMVTSIGNYAFKGCTGLTSVTIGNAVTSIGDSAFEKCIKISIIEIPKSVTSIGAEAFVDCRSLTRVYITDLKAWCEIEFQDYSANPLYYAQNLYLNNELVSGDLIIPEGTVKIGDMAFWAFTGLTSVTIPNSVTSIGDYAFWGCSGLTNIAIPKGVTNIGKYTFCYCTSLDEVWYCGSTSDKNNISIGWYNSYLIDAVWHYNTCVTEHNYFGDCDSTCNNCEWTRTVTKEHSYDNVCDAKCNVCRTTRTVPGHDFNDEDICTHCGAKYIPGDINDSGDVTLDDVVVLAQFIAGWQGVAYNEAALDVNRDGSVTLDDVVLLAQFVAGWNVTLS